MRPEWTPWVAHSVTAAEKNGEQLIIRFKDWAKGLLCKVSLENIIEGKGPFFLGTLLFDHIDPQNFPRTNSTGSRDAIFIIIVSSNNCAT